LRAGQEVRLGGYQSTSLRRNVAEAYAEKQGVLLRFTARAGLVIPNELSMGGGLDEIVLPRNEHWRITKVSQEGNRRVYDVSKLEYK
jgi:hypothetical protein